MVRQPWSSSTARSNRISQLLRFNLFILAFACLLSNSAVSFAQQTGDEKKAFAIQEVAANAQNAKDYDVARNKWQQLIDLYPDSQAARNAHYHLGNCCYNMEDYASAILAYKKALPILRGDESPAIPEVLLALGYSRIREGERLAKSDPEESSSQFATAANDLNTVVLNYGDSPLAGSASFQRGKALESLGQLEEAETAYEKSVEFKDHEFRVNAMFALGRLCLGENDFENASRWYDRIRTVVDKDKGHALLNSANLNYGDSLMNLALKRLNNNELEEARSKFNEAKKVLAEVIDKESFEGRDSAIFMDASCSMYMGDNATAAEGFQRVADLQDSELKERALVLAGTSWLKAGEKQKGTDTLKKAIDSTSSFSVDAVHELALWLINSGKNKEAYELTNKWADNVKGHPLAVDVLLDRANACRNVPEISSASASLYAEIASKYPNHKLAPGCLYQAAYSNYDIEDFDKAIEQADDFEKKYPGDTLLSGIREVKGDSLLMKGRHSEAEAVFRDLATDFQDEKQDLSGWITRAGFASYLQGNYDQTIQWLEEKDASITVPKDQAEALHWIGSSHFQEQRYEEAADKLNQSLDIDQSWKRTPEVMLALCNTQLKLAQFEDAEKTAIRMLDKFPSNPDENVSRALFAVGDESIKAKEFERAIRNFDLITDRYEKSELTPFAIYRGAYAALENQDGVDAAKRFAMFVEKFPEHELVQQATLGQTNALRMSGNSTESIAALTKLVKDAKDDETRRKAQYQLGLAYVDSNDWSGAVETFTTMTETITPDTPDADKVWYELAWAQRENGDNDGSLASFAKLIENHPDSTSAPEAHFLLASKAYADKNYEKAITHYTAADSESARDEIREKARYKLGWCHYKQGNFDAAGKQFQQQVEDFPKGNLYADGRYMVAQCAWRADKFEEAFEAYRVAKPVILEFAQSDDRVKKYASPTLLNGARAGNKTRNYEQAAEMAQSLADMEGIDEVVQQEALLQLGIAKMSLGQNDDASKALLVASEHDDETGAHAKALLGDILFMEATKAAKSGDTTKSKEKFKAAIDAYTDVYYGYGGSLASAEVKPWQAYAYFESARCHMVQIEGASNVDKIILIGKAMDRFQSLETRFPNHPLAKKAKEQIAKLSAIKAKFAQ